MHIPRLFVTTNDLAKTAQSASAPANADALDFKLGACVKITNPAICNQLSKVLRLTRGDKIVLLNGTGLAFDCVLDAVTSRQAECKVLSRQTVPGESVHVSVALAVLKGERFSWALQKLTELGVTQIVPLITQRTVVKIDSSDAKGDASRLTRWQAIVREAAEQSERATIPHLVKPAKFEQWVDEIVLSGARDTAFICAERMSQGHLKDILMPAHEKVQNPAATTGKTTHLLIGPEGGFAEEEIAYAEKQGIKPVSLGRRILRSETAAIYGLAQVMWCLEKN